MAERKDASLKGLQAALTIQSFLELLKDNELVAPCSHCGFPVVTPLQQEDGHLLCFDCEAEMDEENGED